MGGGGGEALTPDELRTPEQLRGAEAGLHRNLAATGDLRSAFLSYARQDGDFVERLVHDLRQAGVQIWRDVEQIKPGDHWLNVIAKALTETKVLLYVASRHSRESPWMDRELSAVMDRSGIVIPLVIDDTGVDSLPRFLAQRQWIDFREGYEPALERLLDLVPEEIRRDRPVEELAKQSKGYVFISYAEQDAGFVQDLKKFLKEHRFAYWDYEESDRDYHSQLFLELEGHIRNSSAVLSIVSPDWKTSEWAVREFFFAEDAQIPTFLLRTRDPGPTLAIAGRAYIDFVEGKDRGFAKLDKELARKGL